MLDRRRNKPAGAKRIHPSACVVAVFLPKLAKHLALIACFLILGAASGRIAASETAIFLTVAAAALAHSIGRVMDRRLARAARLLRCGP
jgi:hypothetical protein